MLSARAKEAVERAGPGRKVAMIVSVDARTKVADVAKIEDRVHRIRTLDDVYRTAKQPLMDLFAAHEAAGVRIIDGLEGTPQVIVSAPARAWRRLFSEPESVLLDPKIHVRPNEADWRI